MNFSKLQKEAHAIANEKGWHDAPRSMGERIVRCHGKLSEALRAYGEKGLSTYHGNIEGYGDKPEGFAIELADLIIRVADMAELFEIDLELAIKTKMKYNRTRP